MGEWGVQGKGLERACSLRAATTSPEPGGDGPPRTIKSDGLRKELWRAAKGVAVRKSSEEALYFKRRKRCLG